MAALQELSVGLEAAENFEDFRRIADEFEKTSPALLGLVAGVFGLGPRLLESWAKTLTERDDARTERDKMRTERDEAQTQRDEFEAETRRLSDRIVDLSKELEDERAALAASEKKRRVLDESLAEYEKMSEEINAIQNRLMEKDEVLARLTEKNSDQGKEMERLRREKDDLDRKFKESEREKREIAEWVSRDDPEKFRALGEAFPALPAVAVATIPGDKGDPEKNPAVLVDSSPKLPPPLKRPKITIPETLGILDPTDTALWDGGGVEGGGEGDGDGDNDCDNDCDDGDGDDEGDEPKEEDRGLNGRKTLASVVSKVPERPASVPKTATTEESDEEIGESPLRPSSCDSRKLKKKKRSAREAEESDVASNEPWLERKKTSSPSSSSTTSESKKRKASSPNGLSAWDPKSGLRQATVTQMFTQSSAEKAQALQAKRWKKIEEEEEDQIRRALEESIKSAQQEKLGVRPREEKDARRSSGGGAPGTKPQDEFVYDLSETQALKLLNDGSAAASDSSTSSRFSKAQLGMASSKSPSLKSSSALNSVPSPSQLFSTPDRPAPLIKRRKKAQHPVIVEMFGESDGESDASLLGTPEQPPPEKPAWERPVPERPVSAPPSKSKSDFERQKALINQKLQSKTATTASAKESTDANGAADPYLDLDDLERELDSELNKKQKMASGAVNPGANDSAFLSFSQVQREKDEERKKNIKDPLFPILGGAIRKKEEREKLKRVECQPCGRIFVPLGYAIEEINAKIWKSCRHGKGKDKTASIGTPEHIWSLDAAKKVVGDDDEGNDDGESSKTKRPRRRKPLGTSIF